MYEKNLEVLRTFHPEVAEQIDQISGLKIDVQFNNSPSPNLYVENNKGIFQPCYSEENPLKDIDSFLDILNEKKGYANCVLGAGLCIHIQAIIDQLDKNIYVVLFEAYPEILKSAMQVIDLSAVFKHPLIKIVTGEKVQIPDLFASDTAKLLSHRGYNFIEFKQLIALTPVWYENVKKMIHQFFIKLNESKKVFQGAGDILFSNRFKNLFPMQSSIPVDILTNRYNKCPVIIVGSGPSLEKNINQIAKARGAVIIAVDSAVAPLIKNNIIPDYVVTADFREFTYEKLAPFSQELKQCRLIYFAEGTPVIPAYLNFAEMYYLFIESPCVYLFNKLFNRQVNPVSDAQSVIHGALHTAQLMGGDPIIFTGLDLAFDGGKDHVEGTLLHWGNKTDDNTGRIVVEDINGKPVYSDAVFLAQKEICEQLISGQSESQYIDASEGGARILGTVIMTLSEVVAVYCQQINRDRVITESASFQPQDIESLLRNLNKLKIDVLGLQNQLKKYHNSSNEVDRFFNIKVSLSNISDLPSSIKKHIHKMDSINNKLNDNDLIKSIKELMGKSYDQYLELTLTDIQNEKLSEQVKQLFSDIKQQVYVQKMRSDALNKFLGIVNEQLEFFSGLQGFKNDPLDNQSKLTIAKYYYKYNFLAMAEKLLMDVETSPESDYYSGCINLKKGNFEKGINFFEKVVSVDNSYLDKVDEFTNNITDSLLVDDDFTALKKLKIDKVLRIDPENQKAWRLLQGICLDEAKQFIKDNNISANLENFKSVWHQNIIPHEGYAILFMVMCLSTGRYERLSEILTNVSKNKDFEDERYAHYEECLIMMENYNADWFNKVNIQQFISWTKREGERLIFLQHVFNSVFRHDVWQLLIFEREFKFLASFSSQIEKWSELEELLPDWCGIKALHSKNSGQLSKALSEINKAIEIEKQSTIRCHSSSDLIYFKAIICVESENYQEALALLRTALKIKIKVSVLLFEIFLILKNGVVNEAEKKILGLRSLEVDADQLAYLKHIKRLSDKNILFPLVIEISSSCQNPVMSQGLLAGYCFLEQKETHDTFIRLIKNIVLNTQLKLDPQKTPLLIDFINKVWHEDVVTIKKMTLEEGKLLLGMWANLQQILSNWYLVNAEFLIIHNRTIGALDLLDEIYSEYRQDIDYLKLYVLQLFIFERTDEAIAIFEELLSISPESVNILQEVGDNYLADCNFSAALTIYEECLALMPENYDVLYNIGDIYLKFGNFESAVLAFETLLLKKPGHDQVKKRLKEIETLKSQP